MEKGLLVDGHAHLYELADLSVSLQEAKAAEVQGIIGVGADIESSKKVLGIAKENREYVYAALGYHPWEIEKEKVEENLSFIQERVEECVALGEVGLDYRIKVKKELQ